MASFNKVILLGNLVADVEARTVGNEKTVADATIAVNDGFGENQEVSYIDMTLWERDAKFASQYLSKGAQVLVEGRLKQDRWQDKETGKTRSKIKLIVILNDNDMSISKPVGAMRTYLAKILSGKIYFSLI